MNQGLTRHRPPGSRAEAPTRVLVVDDHTMFTDLLALQLGACDDIDVVGTVALAETSIDAAERLGVDVVVLDYRLPDRDGITLAHEFAAALPSVRLVMLTGYHDPHLLRAAIAAGCSAFLTKDREPEELVEAVRTAARGDTTLTPDDLRILAEASPPPAHLTQREDDILRLLADGASTRTMADRLHLSVNTVRNHTQRLLTKLGVHSRLDAVATARRLGLLDDTRPH
jgi:DNA-binding NarL/FixJ family response regulator